MFSMLKLIFDSAEWNYNKKRVIQLLDEAEQTLDISLIPETCTYLIDMIAISGLSTIHTQLVHDITTDCIIASSKQYNYIIDIHNDADTVVSQIFCVSSPDFTRMNLTLCEIHSAYIKYSKVWTLINLYITMIKLLIKCSNFDQLGFKNHRLIESLKILQVRFENYMSTIH
jgi:hypothetical protein